MSRDEIMRASVLCLAYALASCQPSSPCDPGYELGLAECVPIAVDSGSGDGDGDGDADGDDDGGADPSGAEPDAMTSEPDDPTACEAGGGDPMTFGRTCTEDADCACPAPKCIPSPLGYCSQIQCDEAGRECPEGFTCFEVPAALQMDGITHLCLQQG